MIQFYFKDKLINDFFYKDTFCVPIILSEKLEKKLKLHFIGQAEKLNNPYEDNKNLEIIIHKNYLFMFLYFLKNIVNIDIFGVFHIYSHSILFSFIYKMFNNSGKVYIKGDFNTFSINNLIRIYSKHKKIVLFLLKKIDIISFENDKLYNDFCENIPYPNKILLIKNSLYTYSDMPSNSIIKKENIILAIGRIYYEDAKRYSFLLKALLKLDISLDKWKIIFIGDTIGKFAGKKYNFLLENKDILIKLKNKGIIIDFLGPIYNRNELYEYLNKSKIFCLSSSSEGDPLVQYESMYYSNLMVSTDVGTIKKNYYDEGLFISGVYDLEKYKENLISAIKLTYNKNINSIYGNIHNYCLNNYTRESNLNELIKELKGN